MLVPNRALDAAINGSDFKTVNIRDHEFTVRPISVRWFDEELTVFGQVIHSPDWRINDEVFFTFEKRHGVVSPSSVDDMYVIVQESGPFKTMSGSGTFVRYFSNIFGASKDGPFDFINRMREKLPGINRDQKWIRALKDFLVALSSEISEPDFAMQPSLEIFENLGLKGAWKCIPVDTNVRDVGNGSFYDIPTSLQAFVPDKKKVQLFRYPGFAGFCLELGPGYHRIADLRIHGFDRKFGSVRWY